MLRCTYLILVKKKVENNFVANEKFTMQVVKAFKLYTE